MIKLSSYEIFLQEWLDNVYSCTQNASPKNEYGLSINDLLSFTLDLFRSLNNFYYLFQEDNTSWIKIHTQEHRYTYWFWLEYFRFYSKFQISVSKVKFDKSLCIISHTNTKAPWRTNRIVKIKLEAELNMFF